MSEVYVYIYDLTKGLARQFSSMFLGKHFDGVWHTGIVAFGDEWFFGNEGIANCPPKGTILGEPNEMLHLGRTELNHSDFLEVISQLSETTFKIGTYNLIEHNCNNFSNELAKILVGKPIPQHIIDLPKEILNTPLGPMLRPMLEQAADPMAGHSFTQKVINSNSSTFKPQASNEDNRMPVSIILFQPELNEDFNMLIEHCNDLLKLNEYNLLVEIKEYLQQKEIRWSITPNHVKVLFELYLNVLKEPKYHLIVLKIFQSASLKQDVSSHISKNEKLTNEFIVKLKETNDPEIKYHSFQMLSNICCHRQTSQILLEKYQDKIFKELSDFALIEASNQTDSLIHESSISFFFNLTSAYHLENHLSDSNALTLGCALLERLPKLKSNAKTIYQMLSLLRSCLSKSQSMRELALSMDFDLSRYQQHLNESAFSDSGSENDLSKKKFDTNDTYESIKSNIDNMIHSDKH